MTRNYLYLVFVIVTLCFLPHTVTAAIVYEDGFEIGDPDDYTLTGNIVKVNRNSNNELQKNGGGEDGIARIPSVGTGVIDISGFNNVSMSVDMANLIETGNHWDQDDFIIFTCAWSGGSNPGDHPIVYSGSGADDELLLMSPINDVNNPNPASIANDGNFNTISVCNDFYVPDDATGIYLTVSVDTSSLVERIAIDNFLIQGSSLLGCTSDADCDNGLFCDGVETCNIATGECIPGLTCPIAINGCVTRGGACDEVNDVCLDVPDDTLCDDGQFCNGIESCDIGTGNCVVVSSCPPAIDGCVTRGASCDEVNDVCVDVPDDSQCSVGEMCELSTGNCILAYTEDVTNVPTMDQWGMIIFMLLAGIGAIYYLRRKRSV